MPLLPIVSSSIRWLPWSAAAFARAAAEHKPVLLFLATRWSSACREMEETTFAAPDVVSTINDHFIPVRVDAERRPDISERYTLAGWPTTAFLTVDGRVLGGGTFVAAERMPFVLARVATAFDSGLADAVHTADLASPADESLECCESDLIAAVFASFDEVRGGFGDGAKFPLVAPLRLALELWSDTQDSRLASIVVTTLDAMGWGGLYDDVDGGFFRYAASPDWRQPHVEKLLEVNAALLHLYVDAGTLLGISRFLDRAGDVLRFTQAWLADAEGGWYGSQFGDRRYFSAATDAARRALPAPEVDRTLFSDANAAMASAVLRAGSVFEDEGLTAYAIRSLERVLLGAYRPGAGVAHYHDGQPRVRGLLADQMAMADAALHAHDLTGNVVYEMMAEELAHYAIRTMWDEQHGGFLDRAADPEVDAADAIGLLHTPLKPFVTNCGAASVLSRLAIRSGDAEFAARAERTLASAASSAHRHGPLAAHYLLALRDLRRS